MIKAFNLANKVKTTYFCKWFTLSYKMPGTAVLLINTGTPDSYKVADVRKYLREFLGDKKVINLPWLLRKALVNFIISPIRGPRSAKLYKEIWTTDGSPLLINSRKFSNSLQRELGSDYNVLLAMRYGTPSMKEILAQISDIKFENVIVVPLYPQYADSTTGSVIAELTRLVAQLEVKSRIKVMAPFFNSTGFIKSFSDKIKKSDPGRYEHILFSFHGLPVKQTLKMHPGLSCEEANCRNVYNEINNKCYYASCYETARLIAYESGIGNNRYTVTFQSRLGMNWLKPYTDTVIKQKALEGAKNILIVSPAFVADCLETIHEIGVEYHELFKSLGGSEIAWVESLNDDSNWVSAMAKMIKKLQSV